MKRAWVVIVNWNGWGDTIACLESVLRSDYPDFRVIVCDNGSSDNSLERIRDWAEGRLSPMTPPSELRCLVVPPVCKPLPNLLLSREAAEQDGTAAGDPPLVLIDNGRNLGFAGGTNVALRHLLARDDVDYVWLLNNDTVVRPDALRRLVERLEEKQGAGICGSTLLSFQRPDRVQALGGGYYCPWIGLPWHLGRLRKAGTKVDPERVERWMNYVIGASMLVSHAFLDDIRLLCEDYFLFFEEADWSIRARGRYTLAYAPESVVYHKVGASIGTSSNPLRKSVTCDYYNVRNRLFFTRRHFPAALPTVYLGLLATIFTRLLCGRWDRARMIARLLVTYNRPLERSPA